MTNGKAIEKLNDKGCYYGQKTRDKTDINAVDINRIGGKMDKIYNILLANLLVILTGTIVGCLVFYLTRGAK